MNHYHVTMTMGRADTFTLEADSKTDVLTFLNSVSEAVVSSIKKLVFSQKYNINYVKQFFTYEPYFTKVLVFAKSETKAQVFTLYYVKKTVTKEIIYNQFKQLYISNEKITDIYNVVFFD